jgi:hypothetical protein
MEKIKKLYIKETLFQNYSIAYSLIKTYHLTLNDIEKIDKFGKTHPKIAKIIYEILNTENEENNKIF